MAEVIFHLVATRYSPFEQQEYPTDLNDDNFAAEMQHLPLEYTKQILEYKN
jgi:hypothetical protein